LDAGMVRIGPYSFAPRVVPTVAALLLIALTLWLGRWQTDRAGEKSLRQELFDARLRETPVQLTGSVPSAEPLLYRRVRAAGRWVPEGQVFIDNQVVEGRAGFAVVTPLRLAGSNDVVLVNRGWTARTRDYPRAPAVAVPEGAVEVTGLAVLPPRRVLELSSQTVAGSVWQNLSIERYRAAFPRMTVLPVVVLADVPAAGLTAMRETPDAGIAKHREYALTWFSLAATTAVLWIVLNLRRLP
jgi:surfeit locus 1 family protein